MMDTLYGDTPILQRNLLWILLMLAMAFGMLITKSLQSIFFSWIAENITMGARQDLYSAVMRKHIGWHDDQKNGTGVISSTLSSDCQVLNGVSSEGTAVMLEATAGLLWGVVLAFFFSWPMAIVGLCIAPLIIVGSNMVAEADKSQFFGIDDDDKNNKELSDVLIGDSIQNYKVVASFANDQVIISKLQGLLDEKKEIDIKSGYKYGVKWGISQGMINGAFGLLYFASGLLIYYYPEYKYTQGEPMFCAMLSLMFGSFTAG